MRGKSDYSKEFREEVSRSVIYGEKTEAQWARELDGVELPLIGNWVRAYYKAHKQEILEAGVIVKNKDFQRMIGEEYLNNPDALKEMAQTYDISPFTIKRYAAKYRELKASGELDKPSIHDTPYKSLSSEELHRLIKESENGKSAVEIAEQLNYNYGQVYVAIKNYKNFLKDAENNSLGYSDKYIIKIMNVYYKNDSDVFKAADYLSIPYYIVSYFADTYGSVFEAPEEMTDQQMEQVINEYQNTKSAIEIAKKTGINCNTVYKILREYNLYYEKPEDIRVNYSQRTKNILRFYFMHDEDKYLTARNFRTRFYKIDELVDKYGEAYLKEQNSKTDIQQLQNAE